MAGDRMAISKAWAQAAASHEARDENGAFEGRARRSPCALA